MVLNRREFVPNGTRVRFVNVMHSAWLSDYVDKVGVVTNCRPNFSDQLISVSFDDGTSVQDMFPDRFELIEMGVLEDTPVDDEEIKELWY